MDAKQRKDTTARGTFFCLLALLKLIPIKIDELFIFLYITSIINIKEVG